LKTPILHEQQKEVFMVVRIQFLKFPPEYNTTVKTLYSEDLVPAIHQFKGLRNARLLEPADKHEPFIAIYEWETEEDARTFERSPLYEQQRKKIMFYTGTEPKAKSYNFEPVHTGMWVAY
jgi:heme-degrading monooxygenase HmoA